jgi:hypothetical protein
MESKKNLTQFRYWQVPACQLMHVAQGLHQSAILTGAKGTQLMHVDYDWD